ncbi:MAG: toxin Cry1Ac domain D-VI-related protein [Coprobacillaceae bacterium]
MSVLKRLLLMKNELTGSIPSSVGSLVDLESLLLFNNKLTGEIPTSIGYLANLKNIEIYNNSVSGQIPSIIGNLTNLTTINLSSNNLTGEIPATIGNLNNLSVLALDQNMLSGNLPAEMGNLASNLTHLNLQLNNLTGSLDPIKNLVNLNFLFLSDNNFTGEIPSQIGNFSLLSKLELSNNIGLTGNVENIFETSPNLLFLNVSGTNTSQKRPNNAMLRVFLYDVLTVNGDNVRTNITKSNLTDLLAELEELKVIIPSGDPNYYTENSTNKWIISSILSIRQDITIADDMLEAIEEVESLFNDSTKTGLILGITQSIIDEAQTKVNGLPNGELKEQLQKDIDLAQSMLDATNKVNDLFDNDGIIKDTVNQNTINEAQEAVNILPNGDLKTELQEKIDDAQRQLNERDAINKVEDLFDTNGTIKDTTNQNTIDDAQNAVNKLPTSDLKDKLQAMIDEAQRQLNEKNKVVKPNLVTGTTKTNDIKNMVTTIDTTNYISYIGLMFCSLFFILLYRKRRNYK